MFFRLWFYCEVKMKERLTTAGVLIKDGLYLVAKRKKGGPLSEKWEFIGGKNRYGETIEDTLKREWLEEVGVEVEVLDFLLLTKFINNDTEYTLYCHLVKTDSLNFQKNVHEEIKWVTKEELKNLPFGPSDGQIRDYLLASF